MNITLPYVSVVTLTIKATTSLIGLFLNVFLLKIIQKSWPRLIGSFSVLLLNTALSDIMIAASSLATLTRTTTCDDAVIFESYGPCSYFGSQTCHFFLSMELHAFQYGVMSQILTFSYRFFFLLQPNRKLPKTETTLIICILIYFPIFVFWILNINRSEPAEVLKSVLTTCGKDSEIQWAALHGYRSYLDFHSLLPVFFLVVPDIPLYILVYFFHRKSTKMLNEQTARMSKTTLRQHHQLVTVATVKAFFPMLLVLDLGVYLLGQFRIYQVDHATMFFGTFLVLLNPIIAFTCVKPYKENVKKIWDGISNCFRRKNPVFFYTENDSVSV